MPLGLAFIGFQAGWFAAVLGAANSIWWFGPAVVAALASPFLATQPSRAKAMQYLTACSLLGLVLDSALTMAGWIRFPIDGNSALSPAWMVALWTNFAWFAPIGLRWLYERPAMAAGLGAVGGPAAYWAGQRLGALEWSTPQAIGAVAAEWAAATPTVLWLATRLDDPGERR